MSLHALCWAFEQKLPCAHKFILVTLGDMANPSGECWPSQKTLAERCGLSRVRVNQIVADLEESGHLHISSRSRKNGADTSNLYILACPPPDEHEGPPPDVMGCVYVLSDGERCKIGITRELDRRIRAISSAAGREIKLAGHIECRMSVARTLERQAHEQFEKARLKGEWFSIPAKEALAWLTARAGEGVSTGLTPTVSSHETPGVNGHDTGVLSHETRISIEPLRNNLPDEPSAAVPPGGSGDLFGVSSPPKPLTKVQVQDLAFDAYDEAAGRLGWQPCDKRTDTRRKKLERRVADAGGIEGWKAALEKAEASDFCMGRAPPRPGKAPFRMYLDFLLQESSFVNLREGKYDNREGAAAEPRGGGSFLEAAGRVAARGAAGGPY